MKIEFINTEDEIVIKTTEKKDVLSKKLLTADVFEQSKTNGLKNLWNEAQDIEITLDFISYGGSLIKKFISKVLPKI